MKFRIAVAALALALGASVFGASQKPKVSIRFHAEANPHDGSSFAMPVKLQYMRRDAHLNRVPAFSERQVQTIFPFQADDGTCGCVFKLDAQGRIRLETMSSEQLNTALVVFVATKHGQHQVMDMLIDRPVTTGMITVPRGFTAIEIAVMKEQFPVIGEEKDKDKKKKKKAEPEKEDVTNWGIDRKRDEPGRQPVDVRPAPAASAVAPARTVQPVSKQKLRELDLPRVAD